jgi:integrase
VTPALLEGWVEQMSCHPAERLHKARVVRRFFEHLRGLGVVAGNPVPAHLTAEGRRIARPFHPFIFTTEQVAAILAAAERLPTNHLFPLRPQTCHAMIAVQYALGLRHGEVRRLRVRDLDLARQALFIDRTKFHKSRHVPFGPKVGGCLQRYLEVRCTVLPPLRPDDPLFVAFRRAPVTGHLLLDTFREILRSLGITGQNGQCNPRLHDLRHNADCRIMPTRLAG